MGTQRFIGRGCVHAHASRFGCVHEFTSVCHDSRHCQQSIAVRGTEKKGSFGTPPKNEVCKNLLKATRFCQKLSLIIFFSIYCNRFQMQLHSEEDQKRPIQERQNIVRGLVAKLRRLERETYLVQKSFVEESSPSLLSEMERLEARVFECKEKLSAKADELDVMLSCYKETTAPAAAATTLKDKQAALARAAEICFKHAQWRLTDADGQLGIADLILTNFLYTKTSKTDDSVEHLLELGYVRMTNLLPNQIYTDVIAPTELQNNMPVDRQRALRVFCREKAPVAGISVKEHFEINVIPLTIGTCNILKLN